MRAVRQVIPDAAIERVVGLVDGATTVGCRFWALDPIDGTKGLIDGRQYVTALALIVDGRVEMSVIGCPHHRRRAPESVNDSVG